MSERWRAGIDIGGTFTDVIAIQEGTGEVRMAKVRTNVHDRLAGLEEALAAVELRWRDVADLVHGTTMVTNALVESQLARVALVATEGFGDVLDIARQSRHTLYRLDALPRPAADVPAERRFEIRGRILADGSELVALDREEVAALPDRIHRTGAEAVAVSLMHSYASPEHERCLREVIGGQVPYISLSHEISPEAREFERTATTVLNAGVMPMVGSYIDRLSLVVPPGTHVQLFQSAGGMTSPRSVRERPLSLALSGPAAGAAGAASVARALGIDRAISFDMGGTTTDVCLILDGEVEIRSDRRIAGRPIRQPIAAIETIGAGGGSIVTLQRSGLFVGPESAGADPGPACYGFGGSEPTISDADLLLGYLDRERPLGGGIRLDVAAAEAALTPLADALGLGLADTALGVARVAHATMARAVRRVSVERGIDARDCALIAFGGAGPMHACGIAEETGMDTIIVPAASGGFSALGCVMARVSFAVQQTLRLAGRDWDGEQFDAVRADMMDRASLPLIEMGLEPGEIDFEEVALMRYAGQSGTVDVPVSPGDSVSEIGARFHAAHEALYGFATGEDWLLESYRVTATGPAAEKVEAVAGEPSRRQPLAPTTCLFPGVGAVETARLWRDALVPGETLPGPLLIVDDWSTTVVAPEFDVTADAAGNLTLRRRRSA